MSRVDIPDNYPLGCSNDEIKKVVKQCSDQIAKANHNSNENKGTNYYTQVAQQGSFELGRRMNKRLISNLENSSKRQRELTWAIIIIGGSNLILGILKSLELIK